MRWLCLVGMSAALVACTALLGDDFRIETDGSGGQPDGGAPAGGGGAGGMAGNDGEPCSDADGCTSGFCVDGVCCEGACDGLCDTCNGETAGTCAPQLAASDPDDECSDGVGVCDGALGCADGTKQQSLFVVTTAGQNEINGFVAGPDGSVLALGEYQSSGTFGATAIGPSTNQDIIIAKLKSDNTVDWLDTYGGADNQRPQDAAFDPLGNAVVVGMFKGTLDFGTFGGPLPVGAGYDNAFVVKIDQLGNPIWAKSITATEQVFLYNVAVDSQGSIILAGYFYGDLDFEGMVTYTSMAGTDPYAGDLFLIKLDGGGNFDWAKQFGDDDNQTLNDVHVTADDEIVIMGYFSGGLSVGGDVMAALDNDLWVAKLDSEGNHVWSEHFGGSNVGFFGDTVWSGAVAADGTIAIGGQFQGSFDVGQFELVSFGEESGYVVKLDPDGVPIGATTLGGGGERRVLHLAMDAAGSVVIAGDFVSSVDCGDGVVLAATGPQSMFAAKLAPDLTCLWSKAYTGNSYVSPRGVAAATDAYVWIEGRYNDNLVAEEDTMPGNGYVNSFIMRYAP